MTYLARLVARATKADAAAPAVRSARLRAVDYADQYRYPDAVTAEAQGRLYAALSWLQDAVDFKASYVATTPLGVYRRTPSGNQDIVNHPLEVRLDRPNPTQSRVVFLRDTSAWIDVCGDAYWWCNRVGESLEELWLVPPGQMAPIPDGAGGVSGYWYDPGNGDLMGVPAEEIVHFKTFNPLSRYVGLSAAAGLALAANADLAAQRSRLSFFDRDAAKPKGILAFADNIDEDRWRRLQEDMKDQTGGTKSGRMMLLRNVGPGGVQWIMTHISQADMQFLESRTFTKEEIFARVAPGMASILAVNATEANATAGLGTFLTFAVYPRQVAIAQKMSLTLLREGEVAEFDEVRPQALAAQKAERDAQIAVERAAMAPPPEPQPDALTQAQKAHERRQWRAKALKAHAAGRSADVPFTPEYLGDDEAMQIRAALRRGDVAGAFGGEQG